MTGRASLRGSLMKVQTYGVSALAVVDPDMAGAELCDAILVRAERLGLGASDRRALDGVVSDVLSLTAREWEAVYEAVVELTACADRAVAAPNRPRTTGR